ncbi:uncharacterized protein ASCRUDRAFT_156923 [Ascoidea rubescens DSM 1968]|uniref:Uncharacterized protein n=1 Tax=Ascoidea rubescens DSM 1968 TaxID=1344418 RepID=A0A1D2VEM2_9ASCO|nr:hypothetical protein ASCRUDRAFT_156923 [Ascoidea rubescens DSM 1968]ODV60148.1 hypothetical protein ASCRUDRAFT_156923 [Ascoidea rubescens DSM 1968]
MIQHDRTLSALWMTNYVTCIHKSGDYTLQKQNKFFSCAPEIQFSVLKTVQSKHHNQH